MIDELLQKYGDYKLCLVKYPYVYFTNLSLDKQWGDDWNDTPYEHNAGAPYKWHVVDGERIENDVFDVMVAGGFEAPESYVSNSEYSVEEINDYRKTWWLRTDRCNVGVPIIELWAGATFAEFLEAARQIEAIIYTPIEWLTKEVASP